MESIPIIIVSVNRDSPYNSFNVISAPENSEIIIITECADVPQEILDGEDFAEWDLENTVYDAAIHDWTFTQYYILRNNDKNEPLDFCSVEHYPRISQLVNIGNYAFLQFYKFVFSIHSHKEDLGRIIHELIQIHEYYVASRRWDMKYEKDRCENHLRSKFENLDSSRFSINCSDQERINRDKWTRESMQAEDKIYFANIIVKDVIEIAHKTINP